MNSLEGKVIAVTGASGIAAAAAAARRFAAEGARVSVFSLGGEEPAAVPAELSGASIESFWSAVRLTEAAFADGRACLGLDGLFAVAGGSGRRFGEGPLDEATTCGP